MSCLFALFDCVLQVLYLLRLSLNKLGDLSRTRLGILERGSEIVEWSLTLVKLQLAPLQLDLEGGVLPHQNLILNRGYRVVSNAFSSWCWEFDLLIFNLWIFSIIKKDWPCSNHSHWSTVIECILKKDQPWSFLKIDRSNSIFFTIESIFRSQKGRFANFFKHSMPTANKIFNAN